MKKLLFVTATLLLCFVFPASVQAQPDSIVRIDPAEMANICGITPEYLVASNDIANGGGSRSMSMYTAPNAFSPGAIITCGKFRLFYEDMNQLSGDGFDDPTLGAVRRATFCAVLNYVQSTIALNVNGTTNFIDLYIERSVTPANPADMTDTYLANAGPYFAAGFGTVAGIYNGHFYDHAITGVDPQANQYDAHIKVNFHQIYSTIYSTFTTIDYWNDYTNTTANCRYDLYSILLHEVTHAMGFLSCVHEDPSHLAVGGPSFSKFDNLFLYYKDPLNIFHKVVTALAIDAYINTNSDPLRTNKIWLNNQVPPYNHPIYSGTLDPSYAVQPASLMSHLNATILSFTAMSQVSPGFQPNYVMGPFISLGQLKRTWTLAEHRILLTLGYSLEASFATATSLNGIDANSWLLSSNTCAYRNNSYTTSMLSYNTPFNFMELMAPDQTMTNNNTPSVPGASFWTFSVGSLANVADPNGDLIRVMPNTLFNIRGCSNGGNNHACVQVNPGGNIITYTPVPGFRGRAQFGFYLWDGHERGALRIVTIDVQPGAYTLTPGNEMVVYSDLEDGTEMRQRVLNPTFENAQWTDLMYESVFAGQNFSGAHPFNYVTNWWNIGGGDITQEGWTTCGLPSNPGNRFYGAPQSEWKVSSYGGFVYPVPTVSPGTNQRYHIFQGPYNYSTLINPVQACNVYRFECDMNFEKTGWAVGQTFQFQLQFVDNPFPGFHTALYYTAPVQVTITSVAPDSWQHVVFDFQYCGSPTSFMNLLAEGIVTPQVVVTSTGNTGGTGAPLTNTFTAFYASPTNCPFVDNIKLKQITPTPPPVTLTTTATPNPVCNGSTTNLQALPTPYLPCNATYSWMPGSLSGYAVTSGPITTVTTFTATVNYACGQTGTGTVTVTPSAIPVITPMGPYCNNDNVPHLLTGTPSGGVFSGPGVSLSGSNYYFTASVVGTGSYTIFYTYTAFPGCSVTVHTTIVVSNAPVIVMGTNGPYCTTMPLQNLNATPAGGTWSGPGVTSNQFNPAIGPGTFVLTYSVTAGCPASATTTVTVVAPPVLTITPVGPFCVWDPAALLQATPAGGTFSGTGVIFSSGNYYFNPALAGVGGPYTITYSYNTSGPCGTVTATTPVTVLPGSIGPWPKFAVASGTNSRSTGKGIVTDANGDIYVIGSGFASIGQTLQLTGGTPFSTNNGSSDIIVAKFSDRCGLVWYKVFGGAREDDGADIEVDASGNVFITGTVTGSFTFAPGYTVTLPGTSTTAAFVAKLNPSNGTVTGFTYSATTVATASVSGAGIAVNQTTGDVYMTGLFNQNISFGALPVLSPFTGGANVFAARFNNALTSASWNARIYSAGTNWPGDVTLDGTGNLYIGCTATGTGNANGTSYAGAGTTGAHPFIVKYSATNVYQGAVILGSNGNNAFLKDIVSDAAGRIFFCGTFYGSITFFSTYTAPAGDRQMYVTRMNNTLTFNSSCWTVITGSTTSAQEDALGIALAPSSGDVYFTGFGENNCAFPGFTPSSMTGVGSTGEGFVARILSSGVPSTLVHTTCSSIGATNSSLAVAVNSAGTQYNTGYINHTTTFGALGSFSPTPGTQALFAARESSAGAFFRLAYPGENTTGAVTTADDELMAYPNPSQGDVTLLFKNSVPARATITVTDISGRVVSSKDYVPGSEGMITLDLSTCENGIYMIIIQCEERRFVKQVVLQR